jgi:hypothetical protein
MRSGDAAQRNEMTRVPCHLNEAEGCGLILAIEYMRQLLKRMKAMRRERIQRHRPNRVLAPSARIDCRGGEIPWLVVSADTRVERGGG